MHSTNGSNNPPNRIKFVWGLVLSVTAMALLYSGGLQAVQNVMIIAAFPFSIILLLMVFSLIKSLRFERTRTDAKQRKEQRELTAIKKAARQTNELEV